MDFFPSVVDEIVEPRPLSPILSNSLLSSVTNRMLHLFDKVQSNPSRSIRPYVRGGVV